MELLKKLGELLGEGLLAFAQGLYTALLMIGGTALFLGVMFGIPIAGLLLADRGDVWGWVILGLYFSTFLTWFGWDIRGGH